MNVKTVLGTMTFGGAKTNEEESKQILDYFHDFNIKGDEEGRKKELDTAILYNDLLTETILGNIGVFQKFKIAGKANPNYKNGKIVNRDCSGLSAKKIRQQCEKSLQSIRADYLDLYYLHWPSTKVELFESLQTINQLYEEGKIKEFGISNYSIEQTREICDICSKHNFILPTVYQGLYNVISRKCEELIKVLRELNIRFYAFNPLAGGLLTTRYQRNDNPDDGRFNKNTVLGKRYQQRYFHDPLFDAVESIRSSSEEFNIPMIDIAIRWIYYHSALNGDHGDAVILGASTLAQLTENLNAINRGPLPAELLPRLDDAYSRCEQTSPNYFR